MPVSAAAAMAKVVLEVATGDDRAWKVVGMIGQAARSGKVGDGKIIALPVEAAVRLRTGGHQGLRAP